MSVHPDSMRAARELMGILPRMFPTRHFTALPCEHAGTVILGYLWGDGDDGRMEYVHVDALRFARHLDQTKGAGVIAMLHKKWERRETHG